MRGHDDLISVWYVLMAMPVCLLDGMASYTVREVGFGSFDSVETQSRLLWVSSDVLAFPKKFTTMVNYDNDIYAFRLQWSLRSIWIWTSVFP